VPLSPFVALPPLLLNAALPLKLPAWIGLKTTCTSPVWLSWTLNGLPLPR